MAQEALEIPPGAIVLRVKVEAVEFTDVESCCGRRLFGTAFDFWYRYRAAVISVVEGPYAGSRVSFGHVQHAEYTSEVTDDCFVVLVPADVETHKLIGVELVAVKLYSSQISAHRDAIRQLGDGI